MRFGQFGNMAAFSPWANQPRMNASTINWFLDKGGSDNSPGSSVDVSTGGGTQVRWRTDDDQDTIDTANPIPIPGAGENYSFWGQFYMEMTARPGSEIVNNMKFYSDGGGQYGTGITLEAGAQYPVRKSADTTGYDLATGTVGDTGDRMDNGANKHTDLTTDTKVDVDTYTSGAPVSLTIGETSTQLDAVGETCQYLVLQLEVGSTATSGTKTAETLTGRYDETG